MTIERIKIRVYLIVDAWSEFYAPHKAIMAATLSDGRRGSFEATKRGASNNGSLAFGFKVSFWLAKWEKKYQCSGHINRIPPFSLQKFARALLR